LKADREFLWESAQKTAFDRLKELLESPEVLAVYDVRRPTTISGDASFYGIGAVLLQKDEDGNQRPVAYVSRTLTSSEKNFAQIEKEALAIAWACNRLQNFLIGKEFVVETDHKPLVSILTTKFLDDLTSRLLRQRFHYSVVHTPGKNLVVADLLSRQPVSPAHRDDEIIAEELLYATINTVDMLSASTSILQCVKEAQNRDIVGQRLRSVIGKTCALARTSVWWPNLDDDVAKTVGNCTICAETRINRSEPLIPTKLPDRHLGPRWELMF